MVSLIKLDLNTIKEDFQIIIKFTNSDISLLRKYKVIVTSKKVYNTFIEYLKNERLEKYLSWG